MTLDPAKGSTKIFSQCRSKDRIRLDAISELFLLTEESNSANEDKRTASFSILQDNQGK